MEVFIHNIYRYEVSNLGELTFFLKPCTTDA